jgi:hypothetical protein
MVMMIAFDMGAPQAAAFAPIKEEYTNRDKSYDQR